jgi:PadR family transcriptional regulator, regulatory protein AphA
MSLTNITKYAILGALNYMPISGYDFKKFSDHSIAYFWNDNYARIYPVLKEMEEEKLVTRETMQTEGRPAKNVYSITEKGRKELKKWLLQPVEERHLREELLLKIFFSEHVPLENIKEKIRAKKEQTLRFLEEYSEIERHIKTDEYTKESSSLPFWLITLNFGKHFREGIIKWCDETMETLESMERIRSELNK